MTTLRINVGALRGAARSMVMPIVEAGARIARDAVVETIEASDPSGRTYRIPGTEATYVASAPGQPPAVREATYRDSWKETPAIVTSDGDVKARAYTDAAVGEGDEYLLGDLLEHGTEDRVNYRVRMAPRPHVRPAFDVAKDRVAGLVRDANG